MILGEALKATTYRREKTYLRVVDLSFERRTEISDELSLMGITEASLFPGLEGACASINARLFGHWPRGAWALLGRWG